jgi:histidine triad (HIT) family protein
MCVFCKIAQHEFSSQVVYEDNDVLAFLDINPITKGHTLIIPKKHYENFASCPSKLFARMHAIAARLSKHYDGILQPKGYNILSNMHEAAGQSVFHVHLHLIPRYDKHDGLDLQFHPESRHQLDESQIKHLTLPIKKPLPTE